MTSSISGPDQWNYELCMYVCWFIVVAVEMYLGYHCTAMAVSSGFHVTVCLFACCKVTPHKNCSACRTEFSALLEILTGTHRTTKCTWVSKYISLFVLSRRNIVYITEHCDCERVSLWNFVGFTSFEPHMKKFFFWNAVHLSVCVSLYIYIYIYVSAPC
jgi:hypothetical protein